MADKSEQSPDSFNFLANYGIRREDGEEVDSAAEWLKFLAEQTAEHQDD